VGVDTALLPVGAVDSAFGAFLRYFPLSRGIVFHQILPFAFTDAVAGSQISVDFFQVRRKWPCNNLKSQTLGSQTYLAQVTSSKYINRACLMGSICVPFGKTRS